MMCCIRKLPNPPNKTKTARKNSTKYNCNVFYLLKESSGLLAQPASI